MNLSTVILGSTSRAGRFARRALVAVLTLAVLVPLASLAPPARAAGEGLREVGRLSFIDDPNEFTSVRGRLFIDSDTRRAVRLYRDPQDAQLVIWAADLDTLADGKRVKYDSFPTSPPTKYGFYGAVGGGKVYAVDEVGWVHAYDQQTLQRVGYFPSVMPPPSGTVALVARREQADGGMRNTPEGQRTVVSPFAALPGNRITAMQYVKGFRKGGPDELLIITHSYVNEADVPVSILTLHRWDAVTGAEIAAVRLDGCRSGRSFGNTTRADSGLAVLDNADGTRELAYGCIGRGLVGEVWTAPLADDGTLGTQVLRGSVATASDFLIDPVGRRATAMTSSGAGQSFVAVDLDRGVVGAVGLSFQFEADAAAGGVGAAVDPVSGRLYALAPPSDDNITKKRSPGGLVLVDGRRAPLPQGFAFTEWAARAAEMLVVDPARDGRPTRIFLRRVGEPFYRVFEDGVPVQADPTLADADRFTSNVAEQEGVTKAAFGGGANGYGLRMLLVGGTNAVPDPVSAVRGESLTKDMVTGFVAAPGCGGTNREVVIASIAGTTSLSDTAATADASPATADPRTVQDLAEPIGSCSPSILSRTTIGRSRTHPDDFTLGTNAFRDTNVPGTDDNVDQTTGPSWPFTSAVCFPPAQPNDAAPHPGDGPYPNVPPPQGFSADVACDLGTQKLTAHAAGAAADLAGIAVGKSETTAKISRERGKGVTVTVTSTVRDLDLAGVATIREVRSVATSAAGGRPGTAKTTFTSAVCGLRAGALSIDACFDPRADSSRQLIDGLNQALAQRQMEMRVPGFDAELAKGTPGGALAAIQKDRFAVQGERLFNNDFLTAVPALELVRVHDSTQGRGRQIVQLAGVQASTAYNIAPLPKGGPGGPPPAPAPAPGGTGVLDTSFAPGASSNDAVLPSVIPPPSNLPSPVQMLATIAATTTYVLRWALRSPGKALSVIFLLSVAFALPLHLLERRRAFATALARRS